MFLLLGIGGVKMSRKLAGVLGICGLGTVAVLSYIVAFTYFFSGDAAFIVDGVRQQLQIFDVAWLKFTDRMVVNIGFLLDPISAMMLVVITTISFMVHLYSWGYMEHEPGFQRYYAFLSLFTFSMLGLVVATNIFQMYHLLGAGGCKLLPADRLLLQVAVGRIGFEEGIYRDPLRRPVHADRNSGSELLRIERTCRWTLGQRFGFQFHNA